MALHWMNLLRPVIAITAFIKKDAGASGSNFLSQLKITQRVIVCCCCNE